MLTYCIKTYHLALMVLVAIVLLSLMPIPEIPEAEDVPFIDKWTHMVMYGTLTLVVWVQYLRSHKQVRWGRLIVYGVLAPAVWGGMMELAQAYLTTYRSGDWMDFLANCVGVMLGVTVGLAVYANMHRRAS